MSLRATSSGSHGRSVRRLHLSLPCLSASHRERLRDAGGVQAGASSGRRSLQRDAPELWEPVRPLYDAGRYAEAADRGRELLEAYPDLAYLNFNVACCESLAGRTADAIEHLRHAIDKWEGCRDMAKGDSDFD